MVENHLPPRIFGVLQGALFVVIVTTLILARRRNKARDEHNGPVVSTDLRSAIRRTGVPIDAAGPHADEKSEPEEPPIAVASALPTWSKDTPAHEILGVSPMADNAAIEAAYRKLLKRYHPDRFASWGKGYQTRAHHVILLIQSARDRLLKK